MVIKVTTLTPIITMEVLEAAAVENKGAIGHLPLTGHIFNTKKVVKRSVFLMGIFSFTTVRMAAKMSFTQVTLNAQENDL